MAKLIKHSSATKGSVKKQRPAKSTKKRASTGAIASGFHEGSRSEILADYLFSEWGTVTPARRQSDYGLDLYCTLTERVGRLARVRDYFSVQVKSSNGAVWRFNDRPSVEWFVHHPLPLFLCTVNKKKGVVCVYHTQPRFQIWALGRLPKRVDLTPEDDDKGKFDPCDKLPNCLLSAPILRVGLHELTDNIRMKELRDVFAYWVGLDRDNCELVRAGLLRFRRPESYETNKVPTTTIQGGLAFVDNKILNRGLARLAEAIECIGGQLAHPYRANKAFGLDAVLLLDRIQKEFPSAFKGDHFWQLRVPGLLHHYVVTPLMGLHPGGYLYSGLDEVEKEIANLPLVKKYLK